VETLDVKLNTLNSMYDRLQPVQKKEAKVTANVLLSLIDRMRVVAPLTYRYSQLEAFAYHTHGRIALDEGTEEGARRAMVHFRTCLEVNEAIDDADGVAIAKISIAATKSKYEGGNNIEGLMKASQELYEIRVAKDGEEHEKDGNNNEELLKASQEVYELRIAQSGDNNYYTIDAGRIYAIYLQKANRGNEAMELLTKLLVTSKQEFGSDHNTTKSVESEMKLLLNEAMEHEMRFRSSILL
jgi:hypothetical protein